MNQLCFQIALRLAANAVCRAGSTGLALGIVFWLICSARQGDVFSYAMGILLLLSGSVSFVLLNLATAPVPKRSARVEQVQDWVVALGFGMLVAVNGLDLLLG